MIFATSFHKNSIGWPQQPPKERVLKFNIIFHDSTKTFCFSKHQSKAKFKNLDDTKVLSCDFPGLKAAATSMTSTASTTSVASMTSTASFCHKIADPDGWIIPSTQMTNTSPFLWNGSSKIQFFTDI